MTQSRFFQVSLLLPLVLWCLGFVMFCFLGRESSSVLFDNLLHAYRVFVPYLIFVALIWKRVGDKPYQILMFAAAFLPVIWGVFFTTFYMVVFFVTEHIIEQWNVLCIMAFWATMVAYLLELIPLLILIIFKNDFRSHPKSS